MPKIAEHGERLVGTATHVCEIFDCFTVTSPSRTLTEIAVALDLRKSSVHRLLRTLVVHGYLSVDPRTRQYRFGDRIANCARAFLVTANVPALAMPYLERLNKETDETAALQERVGQERRTIAQVVSTQPIRFFNDSANHSLDGGAGSRVLRAFSPNWEGYPDKARLSRVRTDGYSVSRGELTRGAIAIYVPVADRDVNSTRYTLGVQAPEFRVSDAKVRSIVAKLKRAAQELSQQLPPNIN